VLGRAAALLSAPTLRAGVAFGSTGTAFAVGNLMLARVMPVNAYGRFGLLISLFNIFYALAPGGLDQLLLRHSVAPDMRLFGRALAGGVAAAALAGLTAHFAYHLPAVDAWLLATAVAGVGVGGAAGGGLRGLGSYRLAFGVTNLSNWGVFGAGLLGVFVAWRHEAPPLTILAGISLLLAAYGWPAFRARSLETAPHRPLPWIEAGSLVGLQVAGSITLQLERIVAPHVLDIVAVAEFNVLASVAIFPFRTLLAAANLVLVPRLRAVQDPEGRIALLRREVGVVLLVLAAATAGILVVAPLATKWLTGGRYALGETLLLAGCVNGCLKMLQAFPQAIVTAYGESRDLVVLNSFAWLGFVTGVIGALVGARWGLPGLVYGTGAGSLAMLVPGCAISARLLRGSGPAGVSPA
jgi:hypothetical protein